MILIALLSHRFQILSAFALSLIFILTNIHQPAYAQSEVQYDASLRTFGQTYEGNLCITVGGASLHTGDDASAPDAETSFTLDIQGTLIVAEAFWSGRDKGQGEDGPPVVAGTGDNTITVNNTSVAATASFFAKVDDRNSPVEVRRAFGYHADVTNLINSGLNTITVGGLNIREDHGVGIIAIYENTNSCPYVAINLSEGLDAVSKSKPAPAGPNGALHCSEFPAANVAYVRLGNRCWWHRTVDATR
ncbi:hypothetical protein KFU94_36115 [Chloroflexi bacterium TSY]|nr:hypothetical protein [Chloroflexi bacterium TSY]